MSTYSKSLEGHLTIQKSAHIQCIQFNVLWQTRHNSVLFEYLCCTSLFSTTALWTESVEFIIYSYFQ